MPHAPEWTLNGVHTTSSDKQVPRKGSVLATIYFAAVAIVTMSLYGSQVSSVRSSGDWSKYGGSPEVNHYSPLSQINRKNVQHLAVAWMYDSQEEGGLETSPLVVHGILYGITPTQKIFALRADSGELLWKFDSGVKGTQPDRGLAYWTDGKESRLLVGVMNFLYCLDAMTGKPVAAFGDGGRVDLRIGLGREPSSAQSVYLTSPGIVYKDMIIVGGRNPESLPAPPGDIRAFDVRTGALRWSFHTIPHPGEPGYDTWPKDAWTYSGAANNWAGMALDETRGILYAPTGSAAMDFYGANRLGDDLFANCLLALNADTGKLIWYFQGVKHDLWDRDFPSHPVLLTVERGGRQIDAVAQTTKQGYLYLFDRTNGQPLFPVLYKQYPASDVPGEVAAGTQPLPLRPEPYARQLLTADILSNRTPAVHQWALQRFETFRSNGQFVPLTLGKDTVVFPGFDGGGEWGGPAVDPETNVIYVNANDLAWTGRLAENRSGKNPKNIYMAQCSMCHGENMAGMPPTFPSLQGIGARLSGQQIASTIQSGKGRMPGFPNLDDTELYAIIELLISGKNEEIENTSPSLPGMQYHFTGYHRFLDPDGYPAVAPPWGTLNAIDLQSGKYLWKIPFGQYPELAAEGMKDTGSENYGGPIVTAGGLLFIGATIYDRKFRAFDKDTGRLLWETTLPFAGIATPITYSVGGKQFVVIAAGGGKDLRAKSGGIYVAFALPNY
jgi:quinoprotein glucose dehydrogenase